MKMETLILETRNGVAILRLNRPHRMNAVTEQMYQELSAVFARLRDDEAVRVVVITGTTVQRADGPREVFCAGADLKEHAAGTRTIQQKRAYIEFAHATTRQVHEFPKPVVAAVNGAARGAGTELALNCDFILMAEAATVAFPETGLGTMVGGGATQILADMVGPAVAKWMVYTGAVIDGKEATKLGLSLMAVPSPRLLEEAVALAEMLAAKAPVSMALAKELVRRGRREPLADVLDGETEAILKCMETEDWAEGARAFVEKRPPVYRGR